MPSSKTEKVPIREIGEVYTTDEWKDYQEILPQEEYDEAFLLNTLTDNNLLEAPEESPLPWVPLHAWRALGQMRSLTAIEPVLRLAEGSVQQAYNDFANLSACIGDKAIEPLVAILNDDTRSEITRSLAAEGLGAIGRSSSGPARARIVESLMDQIRQNDGSDGWVNGAAAEALMMMEERSVGPEVLKMYDEGRIQIGMVRSAELTRFFSR
jgi:HEAT repeat protein